jgi:hypothetical protein
LNALERRLHPALVRAASVLLAVWLPPLDHGLPFGGPAVALAAPADSSHVYRHEDAPVLRAAPTRERPRIDGRLDDAVWASAPVMDRFTQRDPHEGEPASERTEVRILIGDDALYVGARLYDHDPGKIRRRFVRRDVDLASDYFSLFLDSEHDHLTAYRFDVSPAGSYDDAAVDARGSEDRSWDPVWNAAATIDSSGWTAEMEIPLSQLRYHAARDAVWGIQVARWIDRAQELDEFAFTPKREHSDVSRYGHLEGLGDVRARPHLEVLPYSLAQTEQHDIPPGDPFRHHVENSATAGGDLRYRFGALTLDGTVHPDFGQVEVDPAVVNLTAVETFFPEKRPFFIERAELFQFGQTQSHNYFNTPIAFHARRIGREPQRALSDPPYGFVDAPAVTDIAGALKLTGKTASGWSIGALDAVTQKMDARYVDTLGVRREVLVEPLANYAVARVRRDVNEGNTSVGAIATGTNRDRSDPELAALLRSQAYLGGIDFNHYMKGRLWSLDGYVLASTIRGTADAIAIAQRSSVRYYQRPDATHVRYDPTRTHLEGMASLVSLNKISGEHWLGSFTYQDLSPGFENNDLGYIGQVDTRGYSTLFGYKEDRPAKVLRNWNALGFTNHSLNHGGDLTYQGYETLSNAQFTNYWSADLRGSWFPAANDDHLTRGGPLARVPSGGRVAETVATDSRKTYQLRVHLDTSWNDAGGHSLQLTPSLVLHPSTSLLVRLEPTLQRTRDMAQYVGTVADPTATATFGSRYVFATLDQRLVSLDTRVDWTFTPKLSLQVYLQPFVVSAMHREMKQLRARRTYDFDVYGVNAGTIQRDANGVYQIDPDGPGPAAAFVVPDPNFNFRSLRGNAVLRWEYRPGSTLFLVWQQGREDVQPFGDFGFSRDFRGLFEKNPQNTVAVKATYWFSL